MIEFLTSFLHEVWHILTEAAPFVLFGFFAAGLLKALLPDEAISRHLGQKSTGSVLKASLLGIPMPLCSCGVIPAAISLRKQGASKGASAAFLVSTPESGVDSIAITWALLDPLMTIVRPVAAFITATLTGMIVNLLPDDDTPPPPEHEPGCGCPDESTKSCETRQAMSYPQRARSGLTYAFGELLKDIGGWLVLGILIAALIGVLVPDDFIHNHLDDGWLTLVIMLLVGIPLYICASASTPIAAALVLKGLSPGAALVFLLAGPATNAATITVVTRYWGKQTTLVYLVVIATCSLVLGWLLNLVYDYTGLEITDWVHPAATDEIGVFGIASALLLIVLLIRASWPFGRHGSDCS